MKKSSKNKQKKDSRVQIAKLLQASSMSPHEKQKMLFALPKMADEEVRALHTEIMELREEDAERIRKKLEDELAKEDLKQKKMEEMYKVVGKSREEFSKEEEADVMDVMNKLIADAQEDPQKLVNLLIVLGPTGVLRLEKALQRMKADPQYASEAAALDETAAKLKEFAIETYRIGEETDQKLHKEWLKEQIRYEQEKQNIIKGYLSDLDMLAKAEKNK